MTDVSGHIEHVREDLALLTAEIQAARDDLHDVRYRLGDLYEHLYAHDWEPDTGRAAKGRGPRPLWTGPHTIQQTYTDVLAELCRAQWELARHTDVPAHLSHRTPAQFAVPDRAPTLERSEAYAWAVILDGMLVWCQGRAFGGRAHDAVKGACEHVGAARRRIDDLWREYVARPCVHCERPHSGDAKWCWFCERSHKPGGSCAVCGAAA